PAILPDDRRMDGLSCAPVPDDGGFALGGDADGAHVARGDARPVDRFAHRIALRLPDFQRIMLDPAGLGIVLGEFPLRQTHDAAVAVEDDAAGAGSSLVQGEQVSHGGPQGAMTQSTPAALSRPGKGSGGRALVNRRPIWDSSPSRTMAGRWNLQVSAAINTSQTDCQNDCVTFTSLKP